MSGSVSVQVTTYQDNKRSVSAARHLRQKHTRLRNESSQPTVLLMKGEEGGEGRRIGGGGGEEEG